MNITDRLYERTQQRGPVCIGLDTRFDYLPAFIKQMGCSAGERIFEFNKRIIDATHEVCACYKLQIACYEALGLDGLKAYAKTLSYIRALGCIVIADVKRGDISSTAEQYAKAHFTGDFECDMMTINAYMGEDAVSPYYPYIEQGKGLFVLVKTSNPTGREIQDLDSCGMTVYEHMAERVASWGERFIGKNGFSAIGAVAGCTYPEQFHKVAALMPHGFYLIPGYGVQGGTGKDLAEFFKGGLCGVVNSSRGLICAHRGKTDGEEFSLFVRDAVLAMRKDILSCL